MTAKSHRKAFGIDVTPDPKDALDNKMSVKQLYKHECIMAELQQEWEDNVKAHKKRRLSSRGIRSSQISALVQLLIKKGVL